MDAAEEAKLNPHKNAEDDDKSLSELLAIRGQLTCSTACFLARAPAPASGFASKNCFSCCNLNSVAKFELTVFGCRPR